MLNICLFKRHEEQASGMSAGADCGGSVKHERSEKRLHKFFK